MAKLKTHVFKTEHPRYYNLHLRHLCHRHKERIFFNDYVNQHTASESLTLTVVDIAINKKSATHAEKHLEALRKLPHSKTAGLPYKVVMKKGLTLEITQNLEFLDGPTNGQHEECMGWAPVGEKGTTGVIFIKFPVLGSVDPGKMRRDMYAKTSNLYQTPGVDPSWTPIFRNHKVFRPYSQDSSEVY